MKKLFLSVIFPAFNEEKRITTTLRKAHDYFAKQDYPYEVIISDDGSTDKTAIIVENFMKEWRELRLKTNKHKGKAPTLISGLKEAKGEYVLFSDVDLSVGLEELSKFIFWLKDKNYDVAIATREGTGAVRLNEPITRHIMGRVFNFIVQLFVLPGINDTQCGFKMFKKEIIQKIINKMLLYSDKSKVITKAKVSAYDVEMLYIARRLKFNIKEVPVTWVYGDRSTVHNLKDSYNNLMEVLKIWLNGILGKYKF